jgi:acyl carrier protein
MKHAAAERSLTEVRRSVARQLDLAPQAILPSHSLRADLGLGRIELTLLAMQLEDQFQVDLPFFVMEDIRTVAELSHRIDELKGDDAE